MRGILNKLTPEKFEKLVGTVNQMPIDTTERLSAVIDLIFEKVGFGVHLAIWMSMLWVDELFKFILIYIFF